MCNICKNNKSYEVNQYTELNPFWVCKSCYESFDYEKKFNEFKEGLK